MTTLLATTAAPAVRSAAARAIDVVKTYGRGDTAVRALDRASLEVDRGRLTAIMGPSGSGKSTLMHVLAGLDDVDSGTVMIGETEVTGLSEKQRTLLRRRRIGFVFQAFNLVPALTAAENIALPLALAGERPEQEWFDQLVATLDLQERLDDELRDLD